MKKTLKVLDCDHINMFQDSVDVSKWLPDYWTGTAIEMLNQKQICSHDRIGQVINFACVSSRLMEKFAATCEANQTKTTKKSESLSLGEKYHLRAMEENPEYRAKISFYSLDHDKKELMIEELKKLILAGSETGDVALEGEEFYDGNIPKPEPFIEYPPYKANRKWKKDEQRDS